MAVAESPIAVAPATNLRRLRRPLRICPMRSRSASLPMRVLFLFGETPRLGKEPTRAVSRDRIPAAIPAAAILLPREVERKAGSEDGNRVCRSCQYFVTLCSFGTDRVTVTTRDGERPFFS